MPIYSPTGFLDITNATLRTSNTECQNLKIGTGNLYVTSEISPSFELNLSNVTSLGATSPHTLTLSNVTTAIDATSNIITSGNLKIGGLIYTKDWGIRTASGSNDLYVGRFTVHGITEVLITDQGASLGSASKFTITRNVSSTPLVNGIDSSSTINYEWYFESHDSTTYDLWVRPTAAVQTNIKVTSSTYIPVDAPTSPTLIPCANGLINMSGNVVASQNLTVSGNVVASQNLTISGNTFYTSPMSVSVDSNVVTEYTGPHDRPLRKYPEVILPRAAVGADYNGYRIDRSSEHVTGAYDGVQDLFNETAVDYADTWGAGWDGSSGAYSTSTGEHSAYVSGGTTLGTGARLASNVPDGEWVSLKSPNAIKLDNIKIRSRNSGDWYDQFPTDFQIWGSNDGTTWSHVKTFTGQAAAGQSILHTFPVNSTTFYNRHALVVTKIPGTASTIVVSTGQAHFSISELRFNAKEEGSGSLDTTLKTVYNVPATTGTQLEVYYDGQDYSVMPTVGSASVTDKAGGDQTGTPGTGVSFDSTYKAFVFDGTANGKITGTHGLGTGTGITPTISLWFKLNSTGNQRLCIIGDQNTQYKSINVTHFNGRIAVDYWLSEVQTPLNSVIAGQWYHLAIVHKGPGTTATGSQDIYINNVKQALNLHTTHNSNSTFDLQGTGFAIGADPAGTNPLTGSIANFRLYSKALNAGQVQELYDYQKDYFLGSKSQVTLYKGHLGVGVTEPSGQLELAGDERIQEYPPGPMSGYETLIPGHGVFCVDFANWYSGNTPWGMYKKNNDVGGQENVWYGPYQNNNGYSAGHVYTGTDFAASTTSGLFLDDVDGTRYYGAWTTIAMPHDIYLKQIHIHQGGSSVGSSTSCAPEDGVILGSNDGTKWYHVHTFTGLQYGGTAGTSSYSAAGEGVVVNAKRPYSHYALITTRTHHNDFTVIIGELRWFGTPGPTTLDKGSLTLGRSLDVPRVSRYDVDTETPRPEKLVVDFDTTVNSSPTDISGKGNHGAFKGTNMNYSSADKAFMFNGTNDYIQTAPLGFSGDQVHSVSLWFWSDVEQSTFGVNEHALYGTGGLSSTPAETGISIYNAYAQVWRAAGATKYPMTFNANQWNHICMAYSSGGSVNSRLWLNGVELAQDSSVTSTGAYSFQPGEYLILGTWINNATVNTSYTWDGKMSNFKLYNVALEPSEVKKLYNLGRTGRSMVISDTAVGIGKVPEAQLDVRGVISCNGAIRITGADRTSGGSPDPSPGPDFLRIRLADTFGVGEAHGQNIPNNVMDNGSAIIEYTGGQSTINNEGAYIWLNGDTMGIMNTGDTETLHWYDADVFPTATTGRHWYISTTGAITNSSDLTLKNNIRYFDDEYDISNSMLKYSQIKFCKYNWKKELKDPSGVKEDFYGVIAQEIEPLFPEMIKTDEGGLKMIKQERLQYISYHMITNLIQKNADLEARILALENKDYHQALRDLPTATEDPANPVWPTAPTS